jgi:hypothetical protein
MNNPQLGTTTYAHIFAQTPTTNSPGNQVATKEYVDQVFAIIPRAPRLSCRFTYLEYPECEKDEVPLRSYTGMVCCKIVY